MGIETSIGAFVTGFIGGIIFATLGYIGADIVMEMIDEDE